MDFPGNIDSVAIRSCDAFTDFNNTLTLIDGAGDIVAFDDEGCGDAVGRAEIVLFGIAAGEYTVQIGSSQGNVEGRYNVSIICEFTSAPTTAPTVDKSDSDSESDRGY